MHHRDSLAMILGPILALTGCATSHVMVGKARQPIPPDQVKLYLHPPAKYDEIAILDTSSRGSFSFTSQQKMDKAIQRLKKEAASLGANGVLLEDVGDQPSGSLGTGVGTGSVSGNSAYGVGIDVTAGLSAKAAHGMAIYVPPDVAQ